MWGEHNLHLDNAHSHWLKAQDQSEISSSHAYVQKFTVWSYLASTSMATNKKYTGIPSPGGRQVIIAADGSEHAKHAFRWYLQYARMPEDGVTFLHIFEAPSLNVFSLTNPGSVPVEEWGRRLRDRVEKARRLEEDYLAEGQAASLNCAFLSKPAEKIGEGIIRIAQEMDAHLIIMGTRGLGPVSRALLGSVSDFVIHQGVVPVTVVPNPN